MLSFKSRFKNALSLFNIRLALAATLFATVLLHFFSPVYEGPLPAPSEQQQHAYISELSRNIYWRNPVWTLESGDASSSKRQSDLQVFENGIPLGPAHSQHDAVRLVGGGAYSHWGGALYFSSSDNSDPRTNGRDYTIKVTPVLRWWITLISILSGAALALRCLPLVLRNSFARVCAINLSISIGLIAILFMSGEAYIRMIKGIKNPSTHTETVYKIGNIFIPNSKTYWTNFTDYAISDRANSIGFIDREPLQSEKNANEIRIAFIGDSFVEALQVPISQKSHVVLEALLNSKGGKCTFSTAAYGYSGTGQANQLPYYDFFAKKTNPDFVVLVIVGNDLSDNSPLHVALRNGWDPLHNPRATVQKGSDGKFFIFPPQMDYSAHVIHAETTFSDSTLFTKIRKILFKYSMLYKYISTSLHLKYHLNIGVFSGRYTNDDVANDRLKVLQKNNIYQDILIQETNHHITTLDSQFEKDELSPLSLDAIARTDFAISEWKRRADEDGFQLIALFSHSASMYCKKDSLMEKRFANILDKYDIKHFNQCDTILNAGHAPKDANYSHDGHWNPQGHIWAAETLVPFFESATGNSQK